MQLPHIRGHFVVNVNGCAKGRAKERIDELRAR
jgi:hypothetical protein